MDGIQPKQDYGAVSAILEIIKNTKYPILMAANDPWNPNLRDLRNAVKMIEVKTWEDRYEEITQKICSGEKIKCEDNALDQIIEASDGDSRYAINFLQSIAEGYGEVTEKLVSELVRRKERELDPFETVRSVFWARYGWQAKQAVSNSQVEYDLLMRWLSENIPIQYEMLNDIWRGYDALARASIFLTRAKLSSWDMLSYTFDLMGPGVAMAEVEKKSPSWKAKWKKYQFPTLVQQLYKSKRTRDTRDQIIKKIGFHLHSSSTKIYNDVFPFFLIMTSKDLDELAKNLDLSPEEIEFIQSSQVRDVALKETGSTAQPSERTSRSRTTSKSRSKKP